MPFTLQLRGHVPSKKNLYRRGRRGQLFLDKSVKAEIDALILQAQAAWKRGPVEHPNIQVTFYVRDRASDRDNKWATISDVLEKASLISRDNIAHFNGTLTIHPAVVSADEYTLIQISTPQEDLFDDAREMACRA